MRYKVLNAEGNLDEAFHILTGAVLQNFTVVTLTSEGGFLCRIRFSRVIIIYFFKLFSSLQSYPSDRCSLRRISLPGRSSREREERPKKMVTLWPLRKSTSLGKLLARWTEPTEPGLCETMAEGPQRAPRWVNGWRGFVASSEIGAGSERIKREQ